MCIIIFNVIKYKLGYVCMLVCMVFGFLVPIVHH